MKKNISIAIDGPAGAGKSTIAKILSNKLGFEYIDTGAMYRAFTYKIISMGIDLTNEKKILEICNKTKIDFYNNHIYLDGKIVDEHIRTNIINENVSFIAKIKLVREKLVSIQKIIAQNKNVVMDGRDIGTNILPFAEYKFYITASPEERGKRRYLEIKEKDDNVNLQDVIRNIKNRDEIDSTREIAPLKMATDSICIDTTNLSIKESVEKIMNYIKDERR